MPSFETEYILNGLSEWLPFYPGRAASHLVFACRSPFGLERRLQAAYYSRSPLIKENPTLVLPYVSALAQFRIHS